MSGGISVIADKLQTFAPVFQKAFSVYKVIESKPRKLDSDPRLLQQKQQLVIDTCRHLGLASPRTLAVEGGSSVVVNSFQGDTEETTGDDKDEAITTTDDRVASNQTQMSSATRPSQDVMNTFLNNPLLSAMMADPAFVEEMMRETTARSGSGVAGPESAPAALPCRAGTGVTASSQQNIFAPTPAAVAPNASDYAGLACGSSSASSSSGAQRRQHPVTDDNVLSFKDQEIFVARMAQLFASIKQLLSKYDQQRMHSEVFMDDLTQSIEFLSSMFRTPSDNNSASIGRDTTDAVSSSSDSTQPRSMLRNNFVCGDRVDCASSNQTQILQVAAVGAPFGLPPHATINDDPSSTSLQEAEHDISTELREKIRALHAASIPSSRVQTATMSGGSAVLPTTTAPLSLDESTSE